MAEEPGTERFEEFISEFNKACRKRDVDFIGKLLPEGVPGEELASVVDFFHQAVTAVEKSGVEATVRRKGNRFEAVYSGDLGDGMTEWANDFYYSEGRWLKFDPGSEGADPPPSSSPEEVAEPLIRPPESTDRAVITPLGYIESHDGVLDKTYAYAAYKEENPSTGKWYFKIKAKETAGTSLDPSHPSFRSNMAKAAVKGDDFVPVGFHMTPKEGDARLVENRLHFDKDLSPTRIEIHLATRSADGSPAGEKVLPIEWPAPAGAGEEAPQRIPLPKSSSSVEVEQLGYVDSYDVIADKDYAYLAYREIRPDSGKWSIKIKAKSTAGASIDPEHPSFQKALAEGAKKGESYVPWGFRLAPKEDDPRMVETRILFDEGRNPLKVEIHVVTRWADGSAKAEQVGEFPWPSPA
ncbi:MAG: hypothetical protein ACYTFG_05195 [Planctomycetota bacterium]|jgi:hypothetical protein